MYPSEFPGNVDREFPGGERNSLARNLVVLKNVLLDLSTGSQIWMIPGGVL